jgi:hypothetical protein
MSTRLQNTIITVSSPPNDQNLPFQLSQASKCRRSSPPQQLTYQKKALKKMFLSVEIVKEMSEYPKYDDHNSTLDPKNAIPTIKCPMATKD